MGFGRLLSLLGVAQLCLTMSFFSGHPLVLGAAAGRQVVRGARQSITELRCIGQFFSIGEPRTGEQPRWVTVVVGPGVGVAFHVVGGDQILPLFPQPTGKVIPLAQQTFQRDLDDHLTVASVFNHESLRDEGIDQREAGLWQVGVSGNPTHRRVAVAVDGGQPRNKRRAQQFKRGLTVMRVARKNLLDLVVNHIAHAAH